MERVGTVVIGAGVVGAGVAYALRSRADDVVVIEAEPRAGTGVTSRNSGVIHAGLYYPPDSLKMKLCRLGLTKLYDFAEKHGVPHLRTGKFIVANDESERSFLDWLLANVGDHGRLREIDRIPNGVRAERALFSPLTGIVDIHQFVEALLAQSEATVLFNQRATRLTSRENGALIEIEGEAYLADWVVNCAGLSATDFVDGYAHRLARGVYFQIPIPGELDVPHLVYPAVPKGSPGLGIHLTRNIYGEAYLGPDVEWIDREDYAVDPARRDSFFEAASRYLPWLQPDMLQPGYAGIRPKLDTGFADFAFLRQGRLIHCLGIESPGITAAIAIGEHVAEMMA